MYAKGTKVFWFFFSKKNYLFSKNFANAASVAGET
jgi:hypothetical protein